MTATDLDPQAIELAMPDVPAPAGRPSAPTSRDALGTLDVPAGGASSPHPTEKNATPVPAPSGGDPSAITTAHSQVDSQHGHGGVLASSPPDPPKMGAEPACCPAGQGEYDRLRIVAECFWDAQKTRIALGNRLGSGDVNPVFVKDIVASQKTIEDNLRKQLVRDFRVAAPDIAAWVKATPGLGEPAMARLVGATGHPAIAYPCRWTDTPPDGHQCPTLPNGAKRCGDNRHLVEDPPYLRTVSQLWSYCGVGDPTRKRRKGMTADDAMALGNPNAKTLVYLAAKWVIPCTGGNGKRRSPYRDIYDARRAATVDRDWTKGHADMDALRVVSKAILKDLWIVARAGHDMADTHRIAAGSGDPDL